MLSLSLQAFPLLRMLRCPTPGCWQRWVARNLRRHDHGISVAVEMTAANDAVQQQVAAAGQAVVVGA